MKKSLALLASLALFTANAFAQGSNSSRADGFRGLILNQTTSEDTARILGQPAADKVDRLDVTKISKWLAPKHKEKVFRQLSFKNVGDFSLIQLSFLENKLVMIDLEFKKSILPGSLNAIFVVEFALIGGQTSPSDLPNEPGKYPVRFIPTYYPFDYNLVGISDKAFIWVDCSTGDVSRPGRVVRTRQISRVLQRKRAG